MGSPDRMTFTLTPARREHIPEAKNLKNASLTTRSRSLLKRHWARPRKRPPDVDACPWGAFWITGGMMCLGKAKVA